MAVMHVLRTRQSSETSHSDPKLNMAEGV